jgi:ABC-2 type transporter
MYGMLALMVGAMFWDLGERNDFESVQSRVAVSFYCVAFFIFMSVAVLPFTVMERAIVDKEVKNLYYHPIVYQLAQAIASYVVDQRKCAANILTYSLCSIQHSRNGHLGIVGDSDYHQHDQTQSSVLVFFDHVSVVVYSGSPGTNGLACGASLCHCTC